MVPIMSMCMFSAGTPPSALRARIAKLEEERASEVLKAKHLREEVKRDPTLRREIEQETWQNSKSSGATPLRKWRIRSHSAIVA